MSLPKPCRWPGCPAIVRTAYCATHMRMRWAELDRQRPPSNRRGYGGPWPQLRARVLHEQPQCACGAPATDVDHVIPRASGGTDDRRNLVARCHRCHARKTLRESVAR